MSPTTIPQETTEGMAPELPFSHLLPLSVLFIFHSLLVAYINSTYMEQFVSAEGVGILYTLGSVLSAVAFLSFTPLLRRFGNVKLSLVLAFIDIISLVFLGAAESPALAIPAFVIFLAVNPILFLSIDIYAEYIIDTKEAVTGSMRALNLTIMSVAAALAPFAMGMLAGQSGDMSNVYYFAAAIFTLFIFYTLRVFGDFKDPTYPKIRFITALIEVWRNTNLRFVYAAHFLLQFFFAWMVIYCPLYMVREIGLSFEAVGTILAIAMSAYIFFDYPTGWLSDRFWGDKELMAVGFIIIVISTAWISFIESNVILTWMIVLFLTRTGGALVETTTEIYFFRHTKPTDADKMSIFRTLRPFANISGAILGSVTLLMIPFQFMFLVLGLAMLPGILFAAALEDVK